MQNYDFARPAPRKQTPRSNYRPNPGSRYTPQPEPAKKGINVAYLLTVFTFFGFSFGIGLGLYLANTNASVRSFTSAVFPKNQAANGTVSGSAQPAVSSQQPASTQSALPNVNSTPQQNTNEQVAVHNAAPQMDGVPAIQKKRYYIDLGKFKPNVGLRLLRNLKKHKLHAFSRPSKDQIKLYIGAYEDLALAKEHQAKLNNISKEWFGNASIKVYDPKGSDSSS